MLKRLKTVVQQQQEKSATASANETVTQKEAQQFYEGLVCPECHKTFETIDILQKHYEQLHGVPISVENGVDGETNVAKTNAERNFADVTIPNDDEASHARRPLLEKSVSSQSSFVCPQCFQELPSALALETHFSAMHSNESPDNRDVDVLAMRQEINDLRASLKEEKRYATELKKEVEKMHRLVENGAVISSLSPKPVGGENESMYYLQQIQMLEAGKALVTTKMLDLENQVAELTRANESVVREKDRVLEKSLTIAREHASIQALYDEETSRSAVREAKIGQLKEKARELEAQLDQRPSEDDVTVLRKELIHAQMLMNDMAQEKERETNEWVAKCGQLEKKCMGQEEKITSLSVQLKEAVQEKEKTDDALRGELESGTAKRAELEAQVAHLQRTITEQTSAIAKSHDGTAALSEQLEELKKTNEKLKAELRIASEQSSSFRLQLEQKNNEVSEHKRRLDDYETKIKRMAVERDEILKSVEMDNSAKTALDQLAAENAQLTNNLRELENQFAAFQNEAVVETERHRSELMERSTLIDNLERLLENEKSKLDQQVSNFGEENDRLKAELEEKAKSIALLQTRIADMQQLLEESKKFETTAHDSIIKMTKLREDFELSERRWEEERLELLSSLGDVKLKLVAAEAQVQKSAVESNAAAHDLKSMTEKCELAEKRISAFESEKADLIRLREEVIASFEREKANVGHKLDEVSSTLKMEKTRSDSLEDEILELKRETSQLKTEKEALIAEKTATVGELGRLKEYLAKMAEEEAVLKKQLVEKTNEFSHLNLEKQSMSTAKDELAEALKETEIQAAGLRDQLAKVEGILHSTREETMAMLQEKQEEIEKLMDDLEEANEEKRTIEESKEAEILSLKHEKQTLQDQIDNLAKRCEDRDRVYEDVLATKLQLEKSLAKTVEEKRGEIAEKQEQISALLLERDAILAEFQESRNKAAHTRAELEQILSTLPDIERSHEQEKEALSGRIEKLEKELTETKNETRRIREETTAAQTEFENEKGSLTNALSDMRIQLASLISRVEETTSENSALGKRIKDFERQTTDLQEEKRMLLERCIMDEKELEEGKDDCREMKRRLDEAISAMHELAREHQSFQIDIDRHTSCSWIDDRNIDKCMKCEKQFTLMIRKHHCRKCGRVLCADCSSKTSQYGVHPKPVRVCDSCYNELQSR